MFGKSENCRKKHDWLQDKPKLLLNDTNLCNSIQSIYKIYETCTTCFNVIFVTLKPDWHSFASFADCKPQNLFFLTLFWKLY